MTNRFKVVSLAFVFMLLQPAAWSAVSAAKRGFDREEARYRLQNLFNEADLLIRNEKSDKLDLERQSREAAALKIFERIPFSDRINELKNELQTSAHERGLSVPEVRLEGRSPKPDPVPAKLHTDEARFRLSDNQVVETLYLGLTIRGDRKVAEEWVNSWPNDVLRLVEPRKGYGSLELKPAAKNGEWKIQAQAFRYRQVEFPKLVSRNPMELLPDWGRKNPQSFAEREPALWKLVTGTQALQPKAEPLYETRRQFLLTQARQEFFFAKASRGEAASRRSH